MGARRPHASNRRRVAAVALAIVAHLAMFSLLLTGSGRLPFMPGAQQRSTQVWLAPPMVLKPRASPLAPTRRPLPSAASNPHRAVAPAAVSSPSLSPVGAAPPGPSAAAPGPDVGAGVAAALRGRIGCTQPGAPWMSDADRAACRERLAAGAAQVPHLEAMSPVKLAYFNAVAKARAAWLSGRDAGHGLAIGCIKQIGPGVRTPPPPHALRLGPCMIELPRGSLNVDADILPDGETAKSPPAFLTTGHGPFSRPGT